MHNRDFYKKRRYAETNDLIYEGIATLHPGYIVWPEVDCSIKFAARYALITRVFFCWV